MSNLKIKPFILLFVSFISFSSLFFAQEGENILEEFDDNLKPYFDRNLQSEFVVLEGVTIHEFNPQLTSISSDGEILGNVYEGLFTAHPITLVPQNAIASGYKVSRDKKRWIIDIREDAFFSNGKQITAEDVRYSFLTLLSNPDAPYSSLLDIIRGAEDFRKGKCTEDEVGIYVNDENSILISLNSPANYLPKVLCHSAFSIISKEPDVYSGAYVIDEVTDKKTVLKKNPYYWDSSNVAIDKVIFFQSDDAEERTYLYNTGKADWVMGNVNVDDILDQDAIQLDPSFGVSFFFFKQSSNNPAKKDIGSVWDYKEFRNAILEAMPWDDLRLYDFVPATTFVYPLSGYPEVDGFDFTDPLEASLEMKAAREKYNIPEDEIIPLVIEIGTGSLPSDIMDSVITSLAPIGVEVIFREISPALYFSNVAKSDADMFTYSWIGDFADPLTFLELFRGDSSFNESGWHNEEFDRLLNKAALVSDAERYNYLAEAENLLLDEGMVIPVARTVSFNIVDPKEVGGWYPNAFDNHLFRYIYKKKSVSAIQNVVMR